MVKKLVRERLELFGKVRYFGTFVAIKTSTKRKANEQSMKELEREAKSWQQIPHHDNICRFIGICLDPKHLCLVSEYVKDGSVLEYLSSHGFSIAEKYDILQQAAAGVWNLHNANCAHRDLALRNLLISKIIYR
eukprot:UN01534